MNNPNDVDCNDYICQDCKHFQSGICPEEDEFGIICNRFELPRQKRNKCSEDENDNK